MASTIEEIEQIIEEAITSGFRGRLLERGLARSMIWVEGELPEGAPRFAEKLSYDLLSYGFCQWTTILTHLRTLILTHPLHSY